MTGSPIFSHKYKATWVHYYISVSDIASDNWSASTGYFFVALWQFVWAVWGIYDTMDGQ